jgi:hypothetical protein
MSGEQECLILGGRGNLCDGIAGPWQALGAVQDPQHVENQCNKPVT